MEGVSERYFTDYTIECQDILVDEVNHRGDNSTHLKSIVVRDETLNSKVLSKNI